jgi:hypothetical protein
MRNTERAQARQFLVNDMANPFDQFDAPVKAGNPFDQFDSSPAATPQPAPLLSSESETDKFFKAPASVQEKTSSEFLKSADPTMGQYAGASAIGESSALDNPAIKTREDFEKAYTDPLITLPKPDAGGDDTIRGIPTPGNILGSASAKGVVRGVEGFAEGLTSPFNIALMLSIGALPGPVQRVASLGFAATMAKDIPARVGDAMAAKTPGERAEAITGAALLTLMAASAFGHANSPIRAKEVLRAQGLPQQEVDEAFKRINQGKISKDDLSKIPDSEFDAAIKDFDHSPFRHIPRDVFESEIARRAVNVMTTPMGGISTAPTLQEPAAQSPSEAQPVREGVPSVQPTPKVNLFQQERARQAAELKAKADEAAKNPDTSQTATATQQLASAIESIQPEPKGGETPNEQVQTEKGQQEKGLLTDPTATGEEVPPSSPNAIPDHDPESLGAKEWIETPTKPLDYKIPQRAENAGDKLVQINIPKFDPSFQQDGGFYIPPGGEGVTGRRAGVEKFLKTGKPVEAPEVHVDKDGIASFINGRHHYSVIRDMGHESMPMAMDSESEENARKAGLIHGDDPKPVIDETVYHSTAHPGNLATEGIERIGATPGSVGIYTTPERSDAEGWGGDTAQVRRMRVKLFKPFDVRDVPLDKPMTKEKLAAMLRAKGLDVQAADIPGEDRTMPFDEWKPEIEGLTGKMRDAGFDGYVTKTTVGSEEITEHVPFDSKALTPEEQPEKWTRDSLRKAPDTDVIKWAETRPEYAQMLKDFENPGARQKSYVARELAKKSIKSEGAKTTVLKSEFAKQVENAVAAIPKSFGNNKTWIHEAYDKWKEDTGSSDTLDQFKRNLMDARASGEITLSRADLTGAFPKEKADQSAMGDSLSQYHFITQESQPGAVETPGTEPIAAKKAPAEATPTAKGERPVVTPAIRLSNGQVFTAQDHVSAYETAKHVTPDTSGSQEGFVDASGKFISREEAAQQTGLPTATEEGKLHSSDLPETPTEKQVAEHYEDIGALLGDEEPPTTSPEPEKPSPVGKRWAEMTKDEQIGVLAGNLARETTKKGRKVVQDKIDALKGEAKTAAIKVEESTVEPTGNDTLNELLRKEAAFLKVTQPEAGPKELWQKTRSEASDEGTKGFSHMTAVRDAVKRGDAVPKAVLNDFKQYAWAREAMGEGPKLTKSEKALERGLMGLVEALKELPEEGEGKPKRRKGEEGSTIIPNEIAERVFSAGKFAYEKGMDAAAWAGRMAKAFGKKIRPFLEDAWNRVVEWNRSKGESGAIGGTPGEGKLGAERLAFIAAAGKAPLRAAWKAGKEMIDVGEEMIKKGFSREEAMPPNTDIIKRSMDVLREQMAGKPFDEEVARRFFDPAAEVKQATPPPEPPSIAPETPAGEPVPESPTGIRNAIVDPARALRELPERLKPIRETFGTLVDEAVSHLAADPNAGQRLVDSLAEKNRPMTSSEDALLTIEQLNRQTEYDQASDALDNAQTPEDQAQARMRLAFARDSVFHVYEVGQKAGTANARGLNARKILINQDYTLAKVAKIFREAWNNDKTHGTLTPEQMEEVEKLHQSLMDAQKLRDKETERADEERVNKMVADQVVKRVAAFKKESPDAEQTKSAEPKVEAKPRKPLSKSIVEFVDSQMDAARQRIKDRKGKMFADPLGVMSAIDLADHALIGAGHIIKGGIGFAKWSKTMLDEFGKELEPHLRPIYNAAKEQAKNLLKAEPRDIPSERKATVKGMKERIAQGDKITDLGRYVSAIMDQFIHQGIHEREPLIDAVHATLKDVDPEITRRRTMEAMSNYGDFKLLDRDPAKVIKRDIKGQTRELLKIQDMEAGVAPKATGIEYPTPSDEQRRLTKAVNELKKKGGFVVTDPVRQLKSAIDSKVTRLKNEISDLDFQIATGKRIVREKTASPETPETEALRKTRDDKKAALKELLGTDSEAEEKATQARLEKSVGKIEQKLSSGDIHPSLESPKLGPESQRVAELNARRSELQKTLADRRAASPETKAAKDAAAIKAAEASLERYDEILKTGNIDPSQKAKEAPSARLEQVRSERDAVQQLVRQMRQEAKPKKTPEEIAAKKLEVAERETTKSLAEWETKLADARKGIFEGKKEPGEKVRSQKLEAMKAKIDELKAENDWIKSLSKPELTDEQKALKQFTARKLSQYFDILQREANDDLGPRTKKPIEFKKDKAAEDAELLYRNAKDAIDKRAYDIRQKGRTKIDKVSDFIVKWNREGKLSAPTVLLKLVEAGLIRVVMDPISRAAGQPLKLIPGFGEKAPLELGVSGKAEAAALTSLWSKRGEALTKLKTGHSSQDVLYGDKNGVREMRGFIGNIHGVIKEPVRQSIMARSEQLLAENLGRQGVDITEPVTQVAIKSAALEHADRGIFLGENLVSKYLSDVPLNALRNSKTHPQTARLMANALEFLMPVVKVTTNIGIHSMRLNPLVGFGEAATRLLLARAKGELADRAKGLSAKDGEVISRAFKAGAIGTLLAVYAWMNPEQFGGVYNEEEHKKNKLLKPGQIRTPGASHLPEWMRVMPAWMNHAPELNLLNTVASARRIFDDQYHRTGKWNAGFEAAAFATMSPVKNLPFIDTWVRLFGGQQTSGQKVGAMLRDFLIPGAVTSTMKRADEFMGKPERKPKTGLDEFKLGVPGWRDTVPLKKKKQYSAFHYAN